MKYKIIRILEPDFGCEGRPDGYEQVDDVIIENDQGERKTLKMKDAELYRLQLDEGDTIELDR
jgi:hypothetical protein